ncbi:MAG: PEP-CTERM sorting domain-containing protein, partial [Aeoliella sp.]
PELTITIDRQSGNILVSNPSASGVNIASYSLSSEGGALNPADGVWTSIADTGDMDSGGSIDLGSNWIEFTDPADHNNLSEAQQPGGGGLTLGAGGSINLGNAWIQNGTEDVLATLLSDAGTALGAVVSFTGTEIPNGDMDFDGDIDALDWPIYRSGLFADLSGLSGAEQYQMGDLNGDGQNNELDFDLFKDAFNAGSGGSFAAMIAGVPEPSTWVLLALAGPAVILMRRRTEMKEMNKQTLATMSRISAVLLLAVVAGWAGSSSAVIVWTGAVDNDVRNDANYDFSGSTLTTLMDVIENMGSTEPGVEDDLIYGNSGIAPELPNAAGQVNYGSMAFGITFDNVVSTFAAGSNEGWRAATVSLINGSQTRGFFYVSSAVTVDSTSSIILDGPGNPVNLSTIDMAPGSVVTFTAEDLTAFNAEHLSKFTVNGDPLVDGDNATVVSDGGAGTIVTALIPSMPLTLEINTDTGGTKIINNSGDPIDLDFYKLTSDSDSLDVANWVSIQDNPVAGFPAGMGNGDGWEEGGGSNNGELGEAYLESFSTLADGAMLNLGSAFNQATGMEDVMFRYRDTGTGAFRDVEATYVTGGMTLFDANVDGTVNNDDIPDFVTALLNLGDWQTLHPGLDPLDYLDGDLNGTVNNDDIPSFVAALLDPPFLTGTTSAVPEPSSLALLLATCGGVALLIQRKKGVVRHRKGASSMAGFSSFRLFVTFVTTIGLSASVMASVTNDREYRFGDPGTADATLAPPFVDTAANVGEGNAMGFVLDNFTLTGDDTGPSGAFSDLEVFGPTYTSTASRPGAGGSDFGASFDGVDDRLEGDPLNRPEDLATTTPINYTGITSRGVQMWVFPDAAKLGTAPQTILMDTPIMGGPQISGAGNWTQANSDH